MASAAAPFNYHPADLSDGQRNIDERTIWIGKVPHSPCPREEVGRACTFFFGEVTHVHLKPDLSHGFVHFAKPLSAEKAVQTASVHVTGKRVEIRPAIARSNPLLGDGGDEDSTQHFEGRFEKFRKGHGFLRPLESGGHPNQAGLERGVYVSPSQIERFGLNDGDVVGALVRPPRSRQQRSESLGLDKAVMRSGDEGSWALIQVRTVNQVDAPQCDRGSAFPVAGPAHDGQAQERGHRGEEFEWWGSVELFRKGGHAFLRRLAPELRRSDPEADERVGSAGVFVPPMAVQRHKLVDGDVVRAFVAPPGPSGGPSYVLIDVLEVEHSSSDDSPLFTGIFEAFRKGFGFVRPLPDDEDMDSEPWRRKGAYFPETLVNRFQVRDGQRVTVKVRPPEPGKGDKSATVMDVVQDEVDALESSDSPWGMLMDGCDEETDAAMPPEIAVLLGVRIHGVVTKVVGKPHFKFGFIRAEHGSIDEEVFFHQRCITSPPPTVYQFKPHIGESVFFKVEAKRAETGRWRLLAVNLYFPERNLEAERAKHPQPSQSRWASDYDAEVMEAWKSYWHDVDAWSAHQMPHQVPENGWADHSPPRNAGRPMPSRKRTAPDSLPPPPPPARRRAFPPDPPPAYQNYFPPPPPQPAYFAQHASCPQPPPQASFPPPPPPAKKQRTVFKPKRGPAGANPYLNGGS